MIIILQLSRVFYTTLIVPHTLSQLLQLHFDILTLVDVEIIFFFITLGTSDY